MSTQVNSTNARFESGRQSAADTRRPARSPLLPRLALHAVARVRPSLAAAAAARLFLRTPPRREPSDREREVLAAGERWHLALPDGGRVAAWTWGGGPAVLLVHGWGRPAGQLHAFVEPLARAGFRVTAFDAPGHGLSSGREASIPAFARTLGRVAAEGGPVHAVVAHSMGGAATSLAVAQGLAAGRAAFLGPPADARTWLEAFRRALDLSPRLGAEVQREVERRAGAPVDLLHIGALGPRMRLPLLVVHDREDAEVPWSDGAAVAAAVPGARLVTTEGLGHRRILRDPAVVGEVVRFVSGGAGSRAGR